MKDKLLLLASKIKDLSLKLYALSPFAAGVCVGYLCEEEIKIAIKFATSIVKFILG